MRAGILGQANHARVTWHRPLFLEGSFPWDYSMRNGKEGGLSLNRSEVGLTEHTRPRVVEHDNPGAVC
jgi:hypothetical protein